MINRYSNKTIFKNNLNLYSNILKNRFVKEINQYETRYFKFDYKKIINNGDIIKHTWSVGDRYYKLSYKYYGDTRDWWIIALFNNKPTESHLKIGDILEIPTPLQLVLENMKF
jgi:hypothetical protein